MEWLTKDNFDVFYMRIIDEPKIYSVAELAALLRIAERLKIEEVAKTTFQILLAYLDRCHTISSVEAMEKLLEETNSLTPADKLKWQENRDEWVSDWLSVEEDMELVSIWLASQLLKTLPAWRAVKRLSLVKSYSPEVGVSISHLPHLTQLSIEKLSDLPVLEPRSFTQLRVLTITTEVKLNDLDCASLSAVLLLPSLKTLEISCTAIEKLAALKVSEHFESLRLIAPKSMPIADQNALVNLPKLQFLDIICRGMINIVLKDLTALRIRLLEKPDNTAFATLTKLPCELLEFGDGFGDDYAFLTQIMSLNQLSILCLNRTISRYLCRFVETEQAKQSNLYNYIHKLAALELKLLSVELPLLPKIMSRSVRQLNIKLVDPHTVDITTTLLEVFDVPPECVAELL